MLVYLLAALTASTAGASGAVFGLFGASFVVGKRLNLDVRWVVGLIGINLAFTFVIPLISSQNISWQGHIGGLVTGAVVAAAYAYAPRQRRNVIQAAVTVVILVLFALLIWWRTDQLQALFGLS
jgi:membrane associated rhomboid family serine protease